MNYLSELQGVAQQVVENPKVQLAVAGGTAAAGLISYTDFVHGVLSVSAIVAGLVATGILGHLNLKKCRNEELKNRILRKQAEGLGIDLAIEDEEE